MRCFRRGSRGGALASTLLVILFLTVFALTLANLATFDLRTVSRNAQKQMAFQAAQAGLDAVTAVLSTDPTQGKTGEVFSATLSDGSSYRVTFDASDTAMPWSANNLDSLTAEAIGYQGRNVPALHASLFSVGTSPSGEISIVESLIRLEGIPYAVAGTGNVRLRNMNVVDIDGDEAHVYSGNTSASSLEISGLLSYISGDARSAGGIDVGAASMVGGEVEEFISPETLPQLTISDFLNPGWTPLPAGPQPAALLGPGGYVVPGDVQYAALTLANTTLYVEGDLTLGAVLGTGTIFVEGETTFLANVNMTGPNRITLFSEGDVNFLLATVFQGVVYSHGNITAAGLFEVFGAVYAVGGAAGGGGNVTLGGLLLPLSNVIYNAESTAFASFWLAQGGEAEAVRVFWRKLR